MTNIKNLDIKGIKHVQGEYCINEKGEVIDLATRSVKQDYSGRVSLKHNNGDFVFYSIKDMYYLAYGIRFAIDEIEDLEGEEWLEVPHTDGFYTVSNKGRVKSYKGFYTKLLKPQLNKGYPRVTISGKYGKFTQVISRVVASAFIGSVPSPSAELHHIDGDKLNNCLDNLIWLEPQEHREAHRLMNRLKKEVVSYE